ncbi:MAG: hypothetical protein KDB53_08570, partial [Planctomycetes bacterium]|nr:hypothetical protein [Planctomycetota bacterium]
MPQPPKRRRWKLRARQLLWLLLLALLAWLIAWLFGDLESDPGKGRQPRAGAPAQADADGPAVRRLAVATLASLPEASADSSLPRPPQSIAASPAVPTGGQAHLRLEYVDADFRAIPQAEILLVLGLDASSWPAMPESPILQRGKTDDQGRLTFSFQPPFGGVRLIEATDRGFAIISEIVPVVPWELKTLTLVRPPRRAPTTFRFRPDPDGEFITNLQFVFRPAP